MEKRDFKQVFHGANPKGETLTGVGQSNAWFDVVGWSYTSLQLVCKAPIIFFVQT